MTKEQKQKTKYYKVIGEGFKTRNGFDWMPFLKGEWVEENNCEETPNEACGKGLHVWKDYPDYSIYRYIDDHTFEVECQELLGQDERKARFRRVKMLRLVLKKEIFHSGANLWGADLSRADLLEADLSSANLLGANLLGADLSRANLSRANLSRANLLGADLSEKDPPFLAGFFQ